MKDKKHIVVKDKTKAEFKKMRGQKGMTQDGLVRYFIEQEKLRFDDGR